jgi:hypothetical protein
MTLPLISGTDDSPPRRPPDYPTPPTSHAPRRWQLAAAKARVLDEVAKAEAAGFIVHEDFSVTDSTLGNLSRRTEADNHATAIRAAVTDFITLDKQVTRKSPRAWIPRPKGYATERQLTPRSADAVPRSYFTPHRRLTASHKGHLGGHQGHEQDVRLRRKGGDVGDHLRGVGNIECRLRTNVTICLQNPVLKAASVAPARSDH